jgi:CYTH domain-containing protein
MKEIERKFLVASNAWRAGARGTRYRQGYLSISKICVVRVRTMGRRAALTIKGASKGMTRDEYEYAVPLKDANEMLDRLCGERIVDKTRYEIRFKGHTWEVDVFHGRHRGLVIAEIELKSEAERFEKPAWLGREVTGQRRYDNSALAS